MNKSKANAPHGCGGRTRTDDLRLMKPTSYRCSTPRYTASEPLYPRFRQIQGANPFLPAFAASQSHMSCFAPSTNAIAKSWKLLTIKVVIPVTS